MRLTPAPALAAAAAVGVAVAGWGAWTVWGDRLVPLLGGSPEALRCWVEGFGVWAPVIFVVLMVAQVVLVPIPGSVLTPIGALAFGPWGALALSTAGTTIGSAAVFALVRALGRPLAARLVGPENLDRYGRVVAARGGVWLFVVFLVPFLPDDAVCAAAGLSVISFRRFLVLSILGRLPGAAFSAFAAAGLIGAPPAVWLTAAAAAVAGGILAAAYQTRLRAWLMERVMHFIPDQG